MNSNDLVKLVVIILVPGIVFFAKGYIQEFLSSNETLFVDLSPIETIEKVVEQNSLSVNIVKDFNVEDLEYNPLSGVDPENLARYFSFYRAEIPKNSDKPVIKAEPKRKLQAKPKYNIDFIYIGSDRRYVSIGNNLLEIGDKTGNGEVIKNIENDRIQLQGKWGLRWIPVNY